MRPTLIKNLTLLAGKKFQKIVKASLLIEDGAIRCVGNDPVSTPSNTTTLDGEGLLAIPGLINAHMHIGDSIAKDLGVGKTLKELVHPLHGIKAQLLANKSREITGKAISQTAADMLTCGITTFVDFREGGPQGIELANRALSESRQRILLLCRPNLLYSETDVTSEADLPKQILEEIDKTLTVCSGVGLSGANEYTGKALEQLYKLAKKRNKLMAIHAAESLDTAKFSTEMFHATEIQRILDYATPNMIVHATHATSDDIQRIVENNIGVICCPRANAALGVGMPPISKLLKLGAKVALGTDNVMLNPPDMFREMDYTAKMIKATSLNPSAITSVEILRMATADAADIIGLGSTIGTIEVGKRADIVFLNMTAPNLIYSEDYISSVIHRARPDNITCVMINGEIVHGSIES